MLLVATLLFWQVLSKGCKLYQVLGIIISESAVWIVLQIQERLLQLTRIKFAYMNLLRLSTTIVHMYVLVVITCSHLNQYELNLIIQFVFIPFKIPSTVTENTLIVICDT